MEAFTNRLYEQAIGYGWVKKIGLAAALAGPIAATFTRGMTAGAGFAAVGLVVLGDTVGIRNGAFAIGARTWSCRRISHIANT